MMSEEGITEEDLTEEDVETLSETGYDLAKSKQHVGELYPVLEDAHGNVIDGNHRLEKDPDWGRETRDWIKTDAQLWLARITANGLRRNIPVEERETQFTNFAKALMKEEKIPKEKIVKTIAAMTTYTEGYVRLLLPSEYKREYKQPQKDRILEVIRESSPEQPPRKKLTTEEVFNKFNPNLQEDDFLIWMLRTEAGLTEEQAKQAIEKYRRGNGGVGAVFRKHHNKAPLGKPSNSAKFTPSVRDASVRLYEELTKWYPVNAIDLIAKVAPAKSMVVWQRNMRRMMRKFVELTPSEVTQTVLDQFKR